MLLHTPKGKDVTIDFQFTAPNSASQDMFKNRKSKSEKVFIVVYRSNIGDGKVFRIM